MAVSAYIFIDCSQGKAVTASRSIKKIAGIKMANAVTGPFDIVALGQAKDFSELTKLVVGKVQKVQGVVKTTTSILVD